MADREANSANNRVRTRQSTAAAPTAAPASSSGVNNSSDSTTQSPATASAAGARADGSEQPPAARAPGASAATALVLGSGDGKMKRTSPGWNHLELFEPADANGKNVMCTVKRMVAAVTPTRSGLWTRGMGKPRRFPPLNFSSRCKLLEILLEDTAERGLGHARSQTEMICMVLDPRFKSCCGAVCLNGDENFQESAADEVRDILETFTGNMSRSSIGDMSDAGNATSGGDGSGKGSSSAAGETGSGAPVGPGPAPRMSRMDRVRAPMNKQVARPAGDKDAAESRGDVVLREFTVYMQEAAAPSDPDSAFDLPDYWATRGVERLDKLGTVVVPARWPHVGLLARLYAGIDTTSCQAERNFSALKLVLCDMRAGSLPHGIEMMLLLRLDRHLIPGFKEVQKELGALKAKCDASADAAVAAQNASAGGVIVL